MGRQRSSGVEPNAILDEEGVVREPRIFRDILNDHHVIAGHDMSADRRLTIVHPTCVELRSQAHSPWPMLMLLVDQRDQCDRCSEGRGHLGGHLIEMPALARQKTEAPKSRNPLLLILRHRGRLHGVGQML